MKGCGLNRKYRGATFLKSGVQSSSVAGKHDGYAAPWLSPLLMSRGGPDPQSPPSAKTRKDGARGVWIGADMVFLPDVTCWLSRSDREQ